MSLKFSDLTRHAEDNGMAKLTFAKAQKIRERYAAGGVSQDDLAKRYGVSARTISSVITGHRWTTPPSMDRSKRPNRRRNHR